MILPKATETYDRGTEQHVREELRRADAENFKRGRDVRLEQGERLILRSANGTAWSIAVSNTGVISATAI
jgi:hypothetical protein